MSDLSILQNFFSLIYPKSQSYSKLYLTIGGSENCAFGPFQLLPYSQNEPARKFNGSDDQRMESCYLLYLPQAKFPNNATEIELQRFDKSHVDLNVSNNDLYFKVRINVFIHICL